VRRARPYRGENSGTDNQNLELDYFPAQN